jgi:hypothetical protein
MFSHVLLKQRNKYIFCKSCFQREITQAINSFLNRNMSALLLNRGVAIIKIEKKKNLDKLDNWKFRGRI